MQTFSKSKPSSFTYESLLKEIDKIPEISIEKNTASRVIHLKHEHWHLSIFYIEFYAKHTKSSRSIQLFCYVLFSALYRHEDSTM